MDMGGRTRRALSFPGRLVEEGMRRMPPRVRHPLLGLRRFVTALPRPVLVYQMSKVGSTSVSAALADAGIRALHVHFLGPMWERCREDYRRSPAPPPVHLTVERLLRQYLRWTSHRLKVVTLFRDPIGRHVSSAFQIHHRDGYDIEDSEAMIQRLRSELLEGHGITYCAEWFDLELPSVFDVDVLAHDFDRERGFSIVRGSTADVLTLKLETLDRNWSTLSDFVGRSIEPRRANRRTDLRGADIYEDVRRRLNLPRSAVEAYYDHPWMRHFYTREEIAAFCRRWSTE